MVFALILQGFGITLISLFGMFTSILHCLKFKRMPRKTIFDSILLMCVVFSFIALLFSVLLVSVSAFLDQPGIHSNTHMTMLPFFMFGLYIGEAGSAFSLIFLLFERYTLLRYKHIHEKLNILWISIFLSLFCIIFGILHTIEYELMCYEDGEPHENVFSICPDDQKAFITYSSLRSVAGYKYFTTVMMFLNSALIPTSSIIFFNWDLLYRQNQWTNPRLRRLFVASMFQLILIAVWLVPLSYELHGLSRSLSPWMPAWILKFYEISYFIAILGPSMYPIIFNGTGLLFHSCEKMQPEENPLIDSTGDKSNNSELETVSLNMD